MAIRIEPVDINIFNESQRQAIQMLSNQAVSGLTLADIAKECEITTKTLWRWRQDKAFNDCIVDEAFNQAKAEIPALLATLIKQARGGSAKHLELIFKLFSLLGDTSKVNVTVNNVESEEKVREDVIRLKKELGQLALVK